MVNTVGSLSKFLVDPEGSYILGLWGADRYFRSSSIGLSNTNVKLLVSTYKFLLKYYAPQRIRLRVYGTVVPEELSNIYVTFCSKSKHKKDAYHLYVNSRPLAKEFFYALSNRTVLQGKCIFAYFAGRFDGDGCLSSSNKHCRIVYKYLQDAIKDKHILDVAFELKLLTTIYRYAQANTYCLYFSQTTLKLFIDEIKPYSLSQKLQ